VSFLSALLAAYGAVLACFFGNFDSAHRELIDDLGDSGCTSHDLFDNIAMRRVRNSPGQRHCTRDRRRPNLLLSQQWLLGQSLEHIRLHLRVTYRCRLRISTYTRSYKQQSKSY
jgi:hypothetical protein